MKMNLQYFAGDGGSDNQDGQQVNPSEGNINPSSASAKPSSASSASSDTQKSYTQAYIDSLLADNKAKVAEAEKKAKMTAAEKAKYEQDKAQREMAELKQKNATYEMRDVARSLANDMGFKATAADIKHAAAADETTTKANLDYIKAIYDRGADDTKKSLMTGEPATIHGKSLKNKGKKLSNGHRIAKLRKQVEDPYFKK